MHILSGDKRNSSIPVFPEGLLMGPCGDGFCEESGLHVA